MRKLLLLAIILLTKTILVTAQQVPNVSYFMYDHARTNAGSMGYTDMICATAITKQQWVGMPGAPVDIYFNANAPFKLFGAKHGAGISIVGDAIGFYSDIDFKLSYAYRFSIGDGNLGIGVSGGLLNKKLTPEWTLGNDGNYPVPDDDRIPQGDQAEFSFNLGAGIFYNTEDIYFGVSALNIYAQEIEYQSSDGTTGGGTLATEKPVPHIFATAGYNMQLSNPAYEIKPAMQVFTDMRIVNLDINARLVYNKKVWGGVSYRVGSAIVGMLGINIFDGLEVGYAYDFQTSALSNQSSGSHEVLLNYCFKVRSDRTPQKYKSIRYL